MFQQNEVKISRFRMAYHASHLEQVALIYGGHRLCFELYAMEKNNHSDNGGETGHKECHCDKPYRICIFILPDHFS